MKLSKHSFQRSHIPEITGSSPVGPTNEFNGLGDMLNPFFPSFAREMISSKARENQDTPGKFVLTSPMT